MNIFTILLAIFPWLFVLVPVGIIVAIAVIYRRMNRGNYDAPGPLVRPRSFTMWNESPPSPHEHYDRPPIPPDPLGEPRSFLR